MKYTEEGNTVRLEMDRGDYDRLLLLLGMLVGTYLTCEGTKREGWAVIAFCNRMNEGNPKFTPYEIPKEYQ